MSERKRVFAALRLLVRLAERDLKESSSLGLNNLFFVAVFLMHGSTSATSAVWSAAPVLVVLGLPLLLTMTAGPLSRVPQKRLSLWPLTARGRVLVQLGSFALSPMVWVGLILILLKAGIVLSVCLVGVVVVLRAVAPMLAHTLSKVARSRPRSARDSSFSSLRQHTRGGVLGIIRLSLRQIFSVLDLYAAAMISVGGVLYRAIAPHPQRAAYPILAMGVALALSTYAQRSFALDGKTGLVRYRLLPLRGWQVLLAKDAGYLAVIVGLTAALNLRVGLTFALAAIAVGRHSSLRPLQSQAQKATRWRFIGGDLGTGVLQILVGVGLSMASVRLGAGFSAAALLLYGVSVVGGGWFWERGHQHEGRVTLDPRRYRTPR